MNKRVVKQRARSLRADELATDMMKAGSYMSQSEGDTQKALDLLHLLIMQSYQKVTGTKI